MSKDYKYNIGLRREPWGVWERERLQMDILKDSTPLPKPVTYQDIDEEFKRWVEEDLSIVIEGKKVETIALYTNQKFSEYMQSWQGVDDNRNLMLNFKMITRENNPKTGSLNGGSKSIPGERTYLIKRVTAYDKNNRRYYIDYRMKQPKQIDLIYKVSLVSNRFTSLNKFNTLVNDRFKAITAYIRPNGHYMPMNLSDISDESEYQIDDRQYYSQSFNITVKAYIIEEGDLIVEERPEVVVMGFDYSKDDTYAEIEEVPCEDQFEPYFQQSVILTVHLGYCSDKIKFKTDVPIHITEVADGISGETNIRSMNLSVNDEKYTLEELVGKEFPEGSEFKIWKMNRYHSLEECVIVIYGYDYSRLYSEQITDVTEVEYDISGGNGE